MTGSCSSCAERLQLRKQLRSLFLKSDIEEENGEGGGGREELVRQEDAETGELEEMRLVDSHGHMDALVCLTHHSTRQSLSLLWSL